jgi:hypothetical protein
VPLRARAGTAAAEIEADRFGDAFSDVPQNPQPPAAGLDFAAVRIHPTALSASESKRSNAVAMTLGAHVYFADGAFAPASPRGRRLLGHELAHVIQQAREPALIPQRKTLDEEIDEELNKTATDKKSLDPTNEEYARTLQQTGFNLTHDDKMSLLKRPAKPADVPAWEARFKKSGILADRILAAGPKVTDKEVRAGMLAQDLATAGFIDKAMSIAASLSDDKQKTYVYEQVLKSPGIVSAAQITTVAQHFVKNTPSLKDHAVLALIRDRTGDYGRSLGADKLKAVLGVVITSYAKDPDLIEALSEVLIFNKSFRAPFAAWIKTQGQSELLFRVLRSKWFADEDQAEREEFANAAGVAVSLDPEKDQGWVVTEKQAYYVTYLIDLGAKQKVTIPKPANMTFATVRAWLDASTPLVAQALKAAGDAARAVQVYREIGDIFFYHVSNEEGDVKPDLSGKVSKLEAAQPQKMRLKSDCDVLASYALRLLTGSGFSAVGYLSVVPTDKSRLAHVVGIVMSGKDYYIVSNKTVQQVGPLASVKAAKARARDYGLTEAYATPKPTSYAVYYADAGPNGELTQKLIDSDSTLRQADLEPSAATP